MGVGSCGDGSCCDGGCVHGAGGIGSDAPSHVDRPGREKCIGDDDACDAGGWLAEVLYDDMVVVCPPCVEPAVAPSHRWYIYGSKAVGTTAGKVKDYYSCHHPGCEGRITRTTYASGRTTHTVVVAGDCTTDLQLPPARPAKRLVHIARRLFNVKSARRKSGHAHRLLRSRHAAGAKSSVGLSA